MEKTGKLVLGTVQFGCQYGINSAGRPNTDTVKDILKKAKQFGISMLDTSRAYGNAEDVLGKCINIDNNFQIVSKYPRGTESVSEIFDLSLQKLGVHSIYGYLLHHFEVYRNSPFIWNDFLRLKDIGKVRKIGFSLYQPEELELLLDNNVDFSLIQIPYNLLDRKFEPYLELLHKKGVEVHVRSTFLQGLFFKDRNTLPEKLLPLRPYLNELDEYSRQNGLSISQIALNFNLQNPYIDGVLIGVDNVTQLIENINAVVDKRINLEIDVTKKELLNPVNWN